MNTKDTSICIMIVFSIFMISACGDSPKVIEAEDNQVQSEQSTGIFSNGASDGMTQSGTVATTGAPPVSQDVHSVVVKEVLPTDKYIYMNVEEEGEEYWIATLKQEVKVGETYFYKEGLLKTNFESKEYDRVFDRIYLVSKIVPANHGNQMDMQSGEMAEKDDSKPVQIDMHGPDGGGPIQVEGSMSIKELVENPEKYAGQEVQLSGKVTKVNPNIMDRNWIHLKDGTKDDFDLVLTSEETIPEGAVVTMTGTVTLDKDFGAGYRYDIIIENARLAGK